MVDHLTQSMSDLTLHTHQVAGSFTLSVSVGCPEAHFQQDLIWNWNEILNRIIKATFLMQIRWDCGLNAGLNAIYPSTFRARTHHVHLLWAFGNYWSTAGSRNEPSWSLPSNTSTSKHQTDSHKQNKYHHRRIHEVKMLQCQYSAWNFFLMHAVWMMNTKSR